VTHRVTLAALALALVASGCGSGATNKAGGSHTPTVLRIGASDPSDQPSREAILHFAREVQKLAGGSLHVQLSFEVAGSAVARTEEKTIDLVRHDRYDIGIVGTRAWAEVGDNAFRALQTPFLITTTALLNRVVESPLADEMLASLNHQGFVGLALVPDHLRRPIGIDRAFVSLKDFAQGRIRVIPSRTTAALIRALGAKPLVVSNDDIPQAVADRRVNGEELSLFYTPGAAIMPGNVIFFGKALSVFANADAFGRLTQAQRDEVRRAAAETTRYVAKHNPSELLLDRSFCPDQRRIVLASPRDLRALVRAAQPVVDNLERDPQTRSLIEGIRALKRSLPPTPPVHVAPECTKVVPSATATGRPRSPAFVNGTYRWLLTATDARAFGQQQFNPGDLPMISTFVLKNGAWRIVGPDGDHGTYTIRGSRIRFWWTNQGYALIFELTRDHNGTLHLKPVLPMDRGDQFIWSFKPWSRIGPPTNIQS
jgi:TRAP-type C4-dicarboxylate transport system substrate-binding protein